MRKILTALVAIPVVFGLAQSATAADMPVKAPKPPPAWSWTGFYIGVHAGGIWSEDEVSITVDDAGGIGAVAALAAGAIPRRFQLDRDSWLAGGQWGFNHQVGDVVFGGEGDISGTDLTGTQTINTNVPAFGPITSTAASRMSLFGTSRARLGVAWANMLAYVTGGFAWGRVEYGYVLGPPGGPAAVASFESRYEYGVTVGGGFEYGWGPFSFKVEALWYDLGNRDHVAPVILVPVTRFLADHENRGVIARVGLNYRFGAVGVAAGPFVAGF